MREYFPGQKPDEKVLVMVRPHWLVLLRALIILVVLVILPIIVLIVLAANGTEPFAGTARTITAVLVPAYYLTLATWFFIAWLDFYLDVGIVTSERVVDIDQRGLFRRNIDELDCKMVQDVSADKTGFLQTVFDFGTVAIQTAGERPNFTFVGVPHPEQVVEQIRRATHGQEMDEQKPAEKMEQAAEKLKEAAEKIETSRPTPQPTAQPPAPDQKPPPPQPPAKPPVESKPDDLPREYER